MMWRLRPCEWLPLVGALWLAGPAVAAHQAAVATAPNPHIAAAPAPRAEPRPAIWLLADADTRIYLFGTIHVLHPDLRWRSPALDSIVREADELVLEVDDAEMAQGDADALAAMRLYPPVPLLSRVSPERREPLRRLIAELGLSEDALDGMQTWAVAVMLGVGSIIREYSGDPDAAIEQAARSVPGVEEALTADFRANGRPISGVETGLDQLNAFRDLPEPAQTAMLEQLIDDYASGEPAGNPDEADWISGNVEGIAAEIDELPPELFEALITRRNRNWTEWLIARLDRPGIVLFAVGAGHLAGRESLQRMLAARGFRVTRLN